MNKRTAGIMDIIAANIRATGLPPTLREIASKSGLNSTWTVRYHLKKLAEMGLIRVKKGLSRGIELLKPVFGVPLVGRISAGLPVDAIENIEEYIESIPGVFGETDMFALRVKGDSMEEAGIHDNDIVFIKKQKSAENGDIVAALIGEEATVKRYRYTKAGIKLIPENPKYEPIVSKEINIMGKVIGVIRRYK